MDVKKKNAIKRRGRVGAALFCLALLLAALCPRSASAAEVQKTVRVGYVNAATYEEGGEGEYKRGYGYEYLQRISYVTGWHYEYVYGSFKECYDTLGGVALAESSYVEREVTLADFIREHALMVLGWLLLFIMVLAGMLYALFVNGRKLKAALETAEKEYAYRLYLDNSELEIKANQDALTKIGNRHYFFTKMGELLASHEELTVCYCDLDHLKDINDRFGHEAGDGYLRGFVEAVGGHIRAGDIFARIGGDEFCMVFRRCGRDNAAKKVEQMQALFAAGSTADYPRSFRCGVLHVPENHGALDVLELLRQVDALMYEEKKVHHAAGYQRA